MSAYSLSALHEANPSKTHHRISGMDTRGMFAMCVLCFTRLPLSVFLPPLDDASFLPVLSSPFHCRLIRSIAPQAEALIDSTQPLYGHCCSNVAFSVSVLRGAFCSYGPKSNVQISLLLLLLSAP